MIQKMLTYNFGTTKWTWKVDEIRNSTTVSGNVLDLLKRRMTDLSPSMIEILKIAGCLGSFFELESVQWIWESTQWDDEGIVLADHLETLAHMGFVVGIPGEFPSQCKLEGASCDWYPRLRKLHG